VRTRFLGGGGGGGGGGGERGGGGGGGEGEGERAIESCQRSSPCNSHAKKEDDNVAYQEDRNCLEPPCRYHTPIRLVLRLVQQNLNLQHLEGL